MGREGFGGEACVYSAVIASHPPVPPSSRRDTMKGLSKRVTCDE